MHLHGLVTALIGVWLAVVVIAFLAILAQVVRGEPLDPWALVSPGLLIFGIVLIWRSFAPEAWRTLRELAQLVHVSRRQLR